MPPQVSVVPVIRAAEKFPEEVATVTLTRMEAHPKAAKALKATRKGQGNFPVGAGNKSGLT